MIWILQLRSKWKHTKCGTTWTLCQSGFPVSCYYYNFQLFHLNSLTIVHTPNIFPFTGRNRFVEIKHNNLYQISYTKSFSNLEESPFGCEDYNKIGLYKSQFECLNKCIQGWFVRHNKCLDYYTYIIDMDVCNNCTICQHKREVSPFWINVNFQY